MPQASNVIPSFLVDVFFTSHVRGEGSRYTGTVLEQSRRRSPIRMEESGTGQ